MSSRSLWVRSELLELGGKGVINVKIFERGAEKYDEWFENHKYVYKSELKAIENFIPSTGKGLEIGVGTGRFASALGITVGVDPAISMAKIAKERVEEVLLGKGEYIPLTDDSFDFVLMVATMCFLNDPSRTLRETTRVLKSGGVIVIGMIDKDSFLGKIYESKKGENKFYELANFYPIDQVVKWLKMIGYENIQIVQTVFTSPKNIKSLQKVKEGHGEGGFIVVSGTKV